MHSNSLGLKVDVRVMAFGGGDGEGDGRTVDEAFGGQVVVIRGSADSGVGGVVADDVVEGAGEARDGVDEVKDETDETCER